MDAVTKGRLILEKTLNTDKIYMPKDGKGVLLLYGQNITKKKKLEEAVSQSNEPNYKDLKMNHSSSQNSLKSS